MKLYNVQHDGLVHYEYIYVHLLNLHVRDISVSANQYIQPESFVISYRGIRTTASSTG